ELVLEPMVQVDPEVVALEAFVPLNDTRLAAARERGEPVGIATVVADRDGVDEEVARVEECPDVVVEWDRVRLVLEAELRACGFGPGRDDVAVRVQVLAVLVHPEVVVTRPLDRTREVAGPVFAAEGEARA